MVVGGFEVNSVDEPVQVPFHLIVGAQDAPIALSAGYLL